MTNAEINIDLKKIDLPSSTDFLSDSIATSSTTSYTITKCIDPLKNYLTCGSACPGKLFNF